MFLCCAVLCCGCSAACRVVSPACGVWWVVCVCGAVLCCVVCGVLSHIGLNLLNLSFQSVFRVAFCSVVLCCVLWGLDCRMW